MKRNQNKLLSLIIEFFVTPVICVIASVLLLVLLIVFVVVLYPEKKLIPKPPGKDGGTMIEPHEDQAKKPPTDSGTSSTNRPPAPIIESCGRPWKENIEIKGTIRKVEYRSPPGTGLRGLHLDVETDDQQSIVIHVFPEPKIRLCPTLFSFKENETVTVVGSEFWTKAGKQKNICAAEITQNSAALKFRDPITGKHNNTLFSRKICRDENEAKKICLVNWMKGYITGSRAECKDCLDEIVTWKNSDSIPAECKKCAGETAIKDCAKSQEFCSKNCSGSDKMSPICLKTCMGRRGTMTGNGRHLIDEAINKSEKQVKEYYEKKLEQINKP